ncbi:serine/threonine-protein kinase [Candidatus Parabeggiatoa sp. HSG14]|uniref:serine/threonine-protein kinase n=1 Tax=Candidatus Parabeggiatoa sp. HSG14 TaxID=3055593 RepID=UPI0025A7FA6F|nr:serine/threonine-protein kinase [Thiotrichales bacterium HSG14]
MYTTRNLYNTLPINYELHHYRIQAILGESHFAITYLAQNLKRQQQVVIKEYFPTQLAVRHPDDLHVSPQSNKEKENFEFGLKRFLQEGKALTRLKHQHIVQILMAFQSHNTAYWVMDYESGQSFASVLEKEETATFGEIIKILSPLLSALKAAHKAGCLHLNIKPSHIILRSKDASPVLIDFGVARHALAHCINDLSMIATPGYTPLEQYQDENNQGHWTDVYALGACLYHAISGKSPIDVSQRSKAFEQGEADPLASAVQIGHKRYPKRFLQAVDWALEIAKKDRPKTVVRWAKFIFSKLSKRPPQSSSIRQSIHRIIITVSLVVIIATIFGFWHISSFKNYLAQLQLQQIERAENLENEKNLKKVNFEREKQLARERLEKGRKRTKSRFLALLQEPLQSVPISLAEQKITLPRQEILSLQGHQGGVCVDGCLAFSPDGQLLASGSWDNTIKLWAVKTGHLLRTLEAHKDLVLSVAFSPNGLLIASGSADHTIKLWDVKTGNVLKMLKEETWIGSIAFSLDGQILAAEGSDNTIKLWELSTGQVKTTLMGHNNIITSITFSPDGHLLASSSTDSTIKLWKVDTGDVLRTLTGHKKEVLSVAFSPNGKTLASGSASSNIKLWNVHNGKTLKTLKKHKNWVLSVMFTPDGNTLVSASHDHTIKFWNIQKGKVLLTLEEHENDVNSIAFSPNGRIFASGSRDKIIKFWQ